MATNTPDRLLSFCRLVVFDYDVISRDDFLGATSIPLRRALHGGVMTFSLALTNQYPVSTQSNTLLCTTTMYHLSYYISMEYYLYILYIYIYKYIYRRTAYNGYSLGKTIKNQEWALHFNLISVLVLYAFTLQAFIYVNGAGNNGQVLISMNYSTSSKALCIHVVKAARLSPTHSSTSANPYVKLYVSSILLMSCNPCGIYCIVSIMWGMYS